MPEWMIYILKVNIAIVLFYLGYYFLLRKLTFFYLNRCYLLVGTLFSLLYPSIDIASLIGRHQYLPQQNLQLLRFDDIVQTDRSTIVLWEVLGVLFWAVVVLLVIRFIIRLMTLWSIHSKSEAAVYDYYHYRKVLLKINPFSFWKSIYMNPSLHEEKDLKKIFKHESVHVKELHTVDALFIEIICAVCWVNPAVWCMRLAIKENLEFLTDSKVLDSGVDRKTYQYSLVNMITQNHSTFIANHFNLKALKRRIQMMNKKNSSRLNLGKYFFLVPAITLSVTVFTVSKAYQHEEQTIDEKKQDSLDFAKQGDLAGKVLGVTVKKNSGDETQDSTKKKKDNVLIKVRSKLSPEPLYILDGLPMVDGNLNQVDPNNIEHISVLKDSSATAIYGSRGKYGVVLIATKSGNKNRNIDKFETIEDTSKLKNNLDMSTVKVNSITAIKSKKEVALLAARPAEVVYIIDGKLSEKAAVEKLNTDNIKSIDVTKDSKEKGTIRITTKSRE